MRVVASAFVLLLASVQSLHVCVPPRARRGTPSSPLLLRCRLISNHQHLSSNTRVLASPSDTMMSKEDLEEITDSAPDDPAPILETKDSAPPKPYTPSILWWTKNREEENNKLNLFANAGFLAGVALFTIAVVFGVDSEVSRGWTIGEYILRVPLDNWDGYSEMLRQSPVQVKACTSGIVYALGDLVAQSMEGTELAGIERQRVVRSAIAGLLLHGPMSHVWYNVCEGLFDIVGWNDYWWVPAPKIITDQLLWGPAWNAVYIAFLGVLNKDSSAVIWEAITSTALPLVIAGIRLWPLAHVVTYGLVPKENRLLWVDAVEIIWVTILSSQAAEQARSPAEQEESTS
ncbi:unnamed protein product [Ectocarpus sp. 6 AP-2014]